MSAIRRTRRNGRIPATPRSSRGSTLLELLVAIALAAALLTSVFAFLGDLLATRDRIRAAGSRQASIAALFDRLDADLAMAIAADPARGAGVKGDAGAVAILTRGVLAVPTARAAGLRDLQRHEYRFDRAARRVAARQSALGSDGAGEWFTFDDELLDLRFRYFDGESWRDAFDSAADGGLPMAVEVSIWFPSPSGGDETSGVDETIDATGVDGSNRTTGASDGGSGSSAARAVGDDSSAGRAPEPPARPPDRRRVIAVPDARAILRGAKGAASDSSEPPGAAEDAP
ncbi:MAG: prepilin-type N-terminal cleavage/methylation domain-containing protein [Phycisphaerales bacterium]